MLRALHHGIDFLPLSLYGIEQQHTTFFLGIPQRWSGIDQCRTAAYTTVNAESHGPAQEESGGAEKVRQI